MVQIRLNKHRNLTYLIFSFGKIIAIFLRPNKVDKGAQVRLCTMIVYKLVIANWKVDLEVVGDEGEVKLVMEDFVLNDWMVEQP